LIAEALRRRKAEKLTQREHAALASVSIPTIIAFERGERTLSLAKAFDILRVVGLIEEPKETSAQERFVQDAFTRWRELTDTLPAKSPGRLLDGWYRIDYAIEGDLQNVGIRKIQNYLEEAKVPHTGWPMFWIPRRPDSVPKEVEGVLECWLSPEGGSQTFRDAAHCDFWRAAPTGRMFLIRGYQEDSQETFPPRTILASTLIIWRLGEGLLHAARLAKLLATDEEAYSKARVKFRALYTGLTGRTLSSWANPNADLILDGSRSRVDEALLETSALASEIENDLTKQVFPLVASLFERFDIVGLSPVGIQAEVRRFQQGRF
jgi:transcriptional regulator with XRE-family HTH domain